VSVSDTSISVTATIDAPVERVFPLLADPDRHPDFDGSGMVRHSETHLAITELGDVFTMVMENPTVGRYEMENHVVVYEPDRAIAWAPAAPGRPPAGHTWSWTLEPTADGEGTTVTHAYDWSAVTDPQLLGYFPAVTAEQMQDSVRLLAAALA